MNTHHHVGVHPAYNPQTQQTAENLKPADVMPVHDGGMALPCCFRVYDFGVHPSIF